MPDIAVIRVCAYQLKVGSKCRVGRTWVEVVSKVEVDAHHVEISWYGERGRLKTKKFYKLTGVDVDPRA